MNVSPSAERRSRGQLVALSGLIMLGLLCLAPLAAAQEQPNVRARNAQSASHVARPPFGLGVDPLAATRWRLPEDETYIAHPADAGAATTALKSGLSASPATSTATMQNSALVSGFSVPWDDSPDWMHSAPTLVHAAKEFRHQGLPILHLWQSTQYQLALGLSSHGRAGLYFTQRIH